MTTGIMTRIQEELRAALGSENVVTGASAARYRLGEVEPLAAARPSDETQVSRVLALAAVEGLAVVPWGRGVHQSLGELPTRYDIALDLRRLDRISAYEPGDMTVTVQAGIGLEEIQRHVGGHGQLFPLDPPIADQATLGGAIAANLSGPLRCRYGTARDLILGVRVAHADGTVTKGGSQVVKNATAYDITKLYIGSHGTLAVILSATLRLYPRPAESRGWWVYGAELEACQEVAVAVVGSHLAPHRVEILDAEGARVCGCPSDGPGLLVGFAGVAEALRDQATTLAGMAAKAGLRTIEVADAPRLWDRLRDFPWRSGEASGPGWRATWRGSVLPSDSAKAARALQDAMGRLGRAALAITASHGTIRGEVLSSNEADLAGCLAAARQALESLGGFLVLTDAPGPIRVTLGVWGATPAGIDRMRQLKKAFDPKDVLNPGRFVGGI